MAPTVCHPGNRLGRGAGARQGSHSGCEHVSVHSTHVSTHVYTHIYIKSRVQHMHADRHMRAHTEACMHVCRHACRGASTHERTHTHTHTQSDSLHTQKGRSHGGTPRSCLPAAPAAPAPQNRARNSLRDRAGSCPSPSCGQTPPGTPGTGWPGCRWGLHPVRSPSAPKSRAERSGLPRWHRQKSCWDPRGDRNPWGVVTGRGGQHCCHREPHALSPVPRHPWAPLGTWSEVPMPTACRALPRPPGPANSKSSPALGK